MDQEINQPEIDGRQKRLRSKNLALLAVLVGLVVLFYIITIVRMGGNA